MKNTVMMRRKYPLKRKSKIRRKMEKEKNKVLFSTNTKSRVINIEGKVFTYQ